MTKQGNLDFLRDHYVWNMTDYRIEKDSLGDVNVPADALYGAQTQRAVENFPVSGIRFPRVFIRALGLIKASAAEVNEKLGLLDADVSRAVRRAALDGGGRVRRARADRCHHQHASRPRPSGCEGR